MTLREILVVEGTTEPFYEIGTTVGTWIVDPVFSQVWLTVQNLHFASHRPCSYEFRFNNSRHSSSAS